VGLWLNHAGLHVATVRTMLGRQMVTLMMDSTPLGGKENVEVVDLFNRPNWQWFATDSAAVG